MSVIFDLHIHYCPALLLWHKYHHILSTYYFKESPVPEVVKVSFNENTPIVTGNDVMVRLSVSPPGVFLLCQLVTHSRGQSPVIVSELNCECYWDQVLNILCKPSDFLVHWTYSTYYIVFDHSNETWYSNVSDSSQRLSSGKPITTTERQRKKEAQQQHGHCTEITNDNKI